MEVQFGRGDRGEVGGQRQLPGQFHADLVPVALEPGDLAVPEVAGAGAGGPFPVQGHGAGRERHEDGAGEVLRGADGGARGEPHRVALGLPPVQVQADELGDVLGARVTGDLGRAALLHDPAPLHDDQPVGQHHGVQRVVRDQDGDGLERGQMAAELRAHLQPGAGVQRRERLVQEQQPGVRGEGAGDGHALRLAAGEPPGPGARVSGQAHAVQPLGGLRASLGLAGAPAARPEGHVVEGGQMREEQIVLEDDTDRARLGRRTAQIGAVQPQMAGGERGEAREGAQRGGLAGAVRTQQGDDLTGRGPQRDVQAERFAVDDEARVQALGGGCGGGAGRVGQVLGLLRHGVRRSSSSGPAARPVRRWTPPAAPD